MDLNKVIFETAELRMTIQRMKDAWFFQVLRGYGLTIHVESREFGTYKEAINYAFEEYGLIAENRGVR